MTTITLYKRIGFDENENELAEKKIYIAPQPKARMIRKAAEITENLNINDFKISDLDTMAEFTVELFGHKFTVDDLWDGIDADKFTATILDCIYSLIGDMSARMNKLPNVKAE